jgi:hypothetical protein
MSTFPIAEKDVAVQCCSVGANANYDKHIGL